MKKFFLFLIFFSPFIRSQVIYLPLVDNSYRFIDRLSIEGAIEYNKLYLLLSAKEIAELLNEADKTTSNLTSLDLQRLSYLNNVTGKITNSDTSGRNLHSFFKYSSNTFYLYQYRDSVFSIFLNPILGIKTTRLDNDFYTHTFNGINLFGAYKKLGYWFRFYDNHDNLPYVRKIRGFTPESGVQIVSGGDYSETQFGLGLDLGNFKIIAAKDFINLGSGYDGQIILSEKAPSFPFMELDFNYNKWFEFRYMHAWLNSGLVDSSTIIDLYVNRNNFDKTNDRRFKYLALHYIAITPFNGFNFMLGESVVYSDQLEYLYLIPISFFRLADHYMSKGDSGDNAQMFFNLSYISPAITTKLYATVFIDELSVTNFFNNGNKQLGYTVGLIKIDPGIKNSNIVIEYTHINPFVYMNFNPAQTYQSSGYQMGHWIGSNSDQIHTAYSQDIITGLFSEVFFDYIRKGAKETTNEEYAEPNPSFLYGSISYYSTLGLKINYEPIYTLKFGFEYQRIFKSTGRFQTEYGLTNKNYFSFSLSFGL